jgi:hypothetical protein
MASQAKRLPSARPAAFAHDGPVRRLKQKLHLAETKLTRRAA